MSLAVRPRDPQGGHPGHKSGGGGSGVQAVSPSCPLQAAKLKARLTLMEGWLQGSDCGRPWEPMDFLQGEAPRGDSYQGHHLLQGIMGGREAGGALAGQTPPLLWSRML